MGAKPTCLAVEAVACKARRIGYSVELAIPVRTQGMTANTLAASPGGPAESTADSAACAIACPPQSPGLANSFCWVRRNDSDVEL